MAGEYAFVMKDLRKVVPPKREILRGIYLSFFHGAKIGVLGANGAGKSSLLRIMASTTTSWARRLRPTACASATCRRSRRSIRPRPCAATSRMVWPRRGRCSPGSRR
jgi:ABC-type phosphate/phosphonate transport system ATPase subunit